MENKKEDIIQYTSYGWNILPVYGINSNKQCSCGNASCNHPGKHPITKRGFIDASLDYEQIEKWWKICPNANVGIRTGSCSNLVVIDVDVSNGKKGLDSFKLLQKKYELAIDGPRVKTGSGGYHYYFQYPQNHEIKCKTNICGYEGIDIRADGGYIIAPPSIHASGQSYVWEKDLLRNLPELPIEFVTLCEKGAKKEESIKTKENGKIKEGNRNDCLASFAGKLRHFGESIDVIEAALLAKNVNDCDPPLADNEVKQIANSISKYEANEEEIEIIPKSILVSRPMPDKDMFFGPLGDITLAMAPYTEADPAGIYACLLTYAGCLMGEHCFKFVDKTRHYPKLFVLLVGKTATGRKGTACDIAKEVIQIVDRHFYNTCSVSGLSTGEGLIHCVRDERIERKKKKKNKNEHEEVVVDAGVTDKRKLVIESEFAQTLKVMQRETNTLSPVMRNAWDHGHLSILTKNCPDKASHSHICIIGHITPNELRKLLTETEHSNGFGNRFVFVYVERSKILASENSISENTLNSLITPLHEANRYWQDKGCYKYRFSDNAVSYWQKLYPEMSNDQESLTTSLLSRGPVQIQRIAMILAMVDCSEVIDITHMEAAKRFWDYTVNSTKFIFGESLGDYYSDTILECLTDIYPEGLSQTDVHHLFNRHNGGNINIAINRLHNDGLIRGTKKKTKGRPVKTWFLAKKEIKAKEGA